MIDIVEERTSIACVDKSHVAHAYGKGHSVLFVKMGLGTMTNVSNKLDLNTTNSRETEVVSNTERFPKCTWFRHFILV